MAKNCSLQTESRSLITLPPGGSAYQGRGGCANEDYTVRKVAITQSSHHTSCDVASAVLGRCAPIHHMECDGYFGGYFLRQRKPNRPVKSNTIVEGSGIAPAALATADVLP